VQWVLGDAEKAEKSFFKINQQGVRLDRTEIELLKSRKKANCIAARAIWKGGKGHKFWADFPAENQSLIQSLGSEINRILFTPPLKYPVKNLHLPIAGRPSASLPLIFDFINFVNKVPSNFNEKLLDDSTGSETIHYLKKVRKIAWRINSVHPSSLGLDSIVYFYNIKGQHKISSFRAVILWILEMDEKNFYREFTNVRAKFEDLILKYNDLIQDIGRKKRQSLASYYEIKDFYNECINRLLAIKDIKAEDVISDVIKTTKFKYLKLEVDRVDYNEEVTSTTIKRDTKSLTYIKEALETRIRCKICGARLHENAMQSDHIKSEDEGGLGNSENVQLTHPYCNSTVKN
jgi:HNH endonuclease